MKHIHPAFEPDDYELIREAAYQARKPIKHFARDAVVDAARRVLADETSLAPATPQENTRKLP